MTRGDQTTRRPAEPGKERSGGLVPALTILSHPDLDRIGDVSLLLDLGETRCVELSRRDPDFGPPGDLWRGRPLGDQFLSRTPHRITEQPDGGLQIRARPGTKPSLRLDGEPVHDIWTIAADTLTHPHGALLEMDDRVSLWIHRLPREASTASRPPDLGMVGASSSLDAVRAAILRIAEVDLPVLLRGESGTGKELAARAVHDHSRRAGGPFVAINLGALPPALAAAELFGNVRGAFTGADVARKGYFRAAEGGTLFLDEVGEAPPEIQIMLLRALETGEIVPVGSHSPRRVDVRVIAATDSDLESRAQRGEFKEPLIHRLAAYEIHMPPLRVRLDNLGRLVRHFAQDTWKFLGRPVPRTSPDGTPWLPPALMRQMIRHPWPGNVRQLRNFVRKLVIDHADRPTLPPEVPDLLPEMNLTDPSTADLGTAGERESHRKKKEPPGTAYRRPAAIGDLELEQAWRECDFEPAATARRLGVSRPSIYNLVRAHPHLRLAEDLRDDELCEALAASDGDVVAAARQLEVSARALARRLSRLDRSAAS